MLKIKGLHTASSEFDAPNGSLLIAENIIIPRPGLALPRKGFERFSAGWSDSAYRTRLLGKYNDSIIAIRDTGTSGTSELAYWTGSAWTDIAELTDKADGTAYRVQNAKGSLYITTEDGIRKLDQLADVGTTGFAGFVPPRPFSFSLLTGSSPDTWFADSKRVRIAVVFGRKDATGRLILSAPSPGRVVTNATGGARYPRVSTRLPQDLIAGDIVQIYRSAEVASSVIPGEELQLSTQFELTSSEITAGTIALSDKVPTEALGAALYTSPSQEGIENANTQPPVARDTALFDNCMFYFNTRSEHQYVLTLKSAAALSDGDTLSLEYSVGSNTFTVTYTAKTTPTTTAHFKIETGGDEGENIRDTALNLIDAINIADRPLYAAYLGTFDNTVGLGQILIRRRELIDSGFKVSTSVSAAWLPTTLPSVAANGDESINDAFPDGLAWSKPDQPGAVPLVNRTRIGPFDNAGLRCIPLEEGLMLFTERGLYRLSGSYPNYSIELMDESVRLVGPETAQVLDNRIYCLTTQGVCVISAYDVRVISTPIEDQLFDLLDTNLTNVKDLAFGIAHQYKRSYYLFYPSTDSATAPDKALVYNTYTQTWVTHTLKAICGLSDEQSLYLGDTESEFVLSERTTGTNRDFADPGPSTTITNISNKVLTINNNVDLIGVGDIVVESSTVYSPITAVDTLASTITVASDPGFTTTSVTIEKAIPTHIRWLPTNLGKPAEVKQIHTVSMLYKKGFTGITTLEFETDISRGFAETTIVGPSSSGWGLSPWGSVPWGDAPAKKPIRQWIPRPKQRCTWITLGLKNSYAYSGWELQGAELFGNPGSEKTTR